MALNMTMMGIRKLVRGIAAEYLEILRMAFKGIQVTCVRPQGKKIGRVKRSLYCKRRD